MVAAFVEFLKSIPLAAWTAFIAFFGVWLTNWNNRQQLGMQLEHAEKLEHQRNHKERLEELYALVTQWNRSRHRVYIISCQLMESQITAQEWLEAYNKESFIVHDSRLDMLFSLYLNSSLEAFSAAKLLNDLKLEKIRSYSAALHAKAPSKELLKEYQDINTEFSTALKLLQAQIVKAAKEV